MPRHTARDTTVVRVILPRIVMIPGVETTAVHVVREPRCYEICEEIRGGGGKKGGFGGKKGGDFYYGGGYYSGGGYNNFGGKGGKKGGYYGFGFNEVVCETICEGGSGYGYGCNNGGYNYGYGGGGTFLPGVPTPGPSYPAWGPNENCYEVCAEACAFSGGGKNRHCVLLHFTTDPSLFFLF